MVSLQTNNIKKNINLQVKVLENFLIYRKDDHSVINNFKYSLVIAL